MPSAYRVFDTQRYISRLTDIAGEFRDILFRGCLNYFIFTSRGHVTPPAATTPPESQMPYNDAPHLPFHFILLPGISMFHSTMAATLQVTQLRSFLALVPSCGQIFRRKIYRYRHYVIVGCIALSYLAADCSSSFTQIRS